MSESSSSAFTVTTAAMPTPGPATSLGLVSDTSTSITLSWHAPASAFYPVYQIRYRVKGTSAWTVFPTKTSQTQLTVTGLQPKTTYELEVLTTNGTAPKH